MKPSDITKHFGGAAAASVALGFHRRTVYHWLTTKKIPHRTQKHIEFQTGGALKAAKRAA